MFFFVCGKSFVTIANNTLKYIPEIWEGSDDVKSHNFKNKLVNIHIPNT